jgi:two-component system, OmpR family, sensor histidine kinase CreC
VSLRLRLVLVLLAVYSLGGYMLLHQALKQVRPRYLESMEESLVDLAHLLAAIAETELGTDPPAVDRLREAVLAAQERTFDARIFALRKSAIDVRVYVVDATGRVVFDSTGAHEGADFSNWNDVARTLRGQYGARSTRDEPGNDHTQVLYVAAPIHHQGRIVGAVTVGKPTRGINELVDAARSRLMMGAVAGGLLLLLVLLLLATWIIGPLEQLTEYARQVRDGQKPARPRLPGRTLRDLGAAFEEMRDALEGRQHAERYTQALAHEVKAPLAAIRGAAELIDENMPPATRQHFLENIRAEAARIEQIIQRLLELSSLEARKTLAATERLAASQVLAEALQVVRPAFEAKGIQLAVTGDDAGTVTGDAVLLREAWVNLLQNALDFSPSGTRVDVQLQKDAGRLVFSIEDEGPGIPDYALSRVFERFYSLPRPGGERKSTGLGLALAREIAHLHHGDVAVDNRPGRGARATLWLPLAEN